MYELDDALVDVYLDRFLELNPQHWFFNSWIWDRRWEPMYPGSSLEWNEAVGDNVPWPEGWFELDYESKLRPKESLFSE